jgi:hypothetical protein
VVVDATGVGGGLAAFLGAALGPGIVLPFRYTAATKSELACAFLVAVNAGRFTIYAESPACRDAGGVEANDLRRGLLRQCERAEYAMRSNHVMRSFMPEHRVHDDVVNAAALVAQASPLGRSRTAEGDNGRRGAPGDEFPTGCARNRRPRMNFRRRAHQARSA